jgi:hypothetical protein
MIPQSVTSESFVHGRQILQSLRHILRRLQRDDFTQQSWSLTVKPQMMASQIINLNSPPQA